MNNMKKKNNGMLILGAIGGVIALLIMAVLSLTTMANEDKLKENPYGTKELNEATVELLDNPNYQNIILPDALQEKIKTGDTVYAYLFSPQCKYCVNFTPKLMPIADEYNLHIDQLNMLEFDSAWETYQVESIPTLLVFKDGKEVSRLIGDNTEDQVRQFFDSVK